MACSSKNAGHTILIREEETSCSARNCCEIYAAIYDMTIPNPKKVHVQNLVLTSFIFLLHHSKPVANEYCSMRKTVHITEDVRVVNRDPSVHFSRRALLQVNVAVVEPHLSCVGRVQACDSGSVPAWKPQCL